MIGLEAMEPSLEIFVFDSVTTHDTLVQAIEYVIETIKKWYSSDSLKPLQMTLTKIQKRGPPDLNINVTDTISAKGGLV